MASTGPTVTWASSKKRRFSSRLRCWMKSWMMSSRHVPVAHPVCVGAEAGIVVQFGPSDGRQQAFAHALHGGGEGDELAVAAAIDVARGGVLGLVAGAHADLARDAILDRFRGDEREHAVEEREVDDLAAAGLHFDVAQRRHHRVGAVEAGDHVGRGQRRQGRRLVREAVEVRVAGHALDQTCRSPVARDRGRSAPSPKRAR